MSLFSQCKFMEELSDRLKVSNCFDVLLLLMILLLLVERRLILGFFICFYPIKLLMTDKFSVKEVLRFTLEEGLYVLVRTPV